MGAGLADRQRALLYRCRAQVRRRPAERAGLAGRLHALRPVGAARAGLALALHGELLAGAALVPALLAGHGLGGARRLAEAAEQAREAALLGLVEAVAAAAAQPSHVVVILAGGAALLAVGGATGTRANGYGWPAGDYGALAALELTGLALVHAHRAGLALFARRVVVAANGAWYCGEEFLWIRFGHLGKIHGQL